MPFSASAIFLFYLFHIGKTLPFEDFLHPGKQRKVTRGKIRWLGRLRHGGHAVFGQKLLNTQLGVSRCARKPPRMKRANTLKEASKTIHRSWTQDLTAMPLHTDTDGFLAPSPPVGGLSYKGPALQKIIPVFLCVPPHSFTWRQNSRIEKKYFFRRTSKRYFSYWSLFTIRVKMSPTELIFHGALARVLYSQVIGNRTLTSLDLIIIQK